MFTSGMSSWDYKSLKRGQIALSEKNNQSSEDFLERIEEAIIKETQNPSCTSVIRFCKKYHFSSKTLYYPKYNDLLLRVKSLPAMKKRGNPHGWKRNAHWV